MKNKLTKFLCFIVCALLLSSCSPTLPFTPTETETPNSSETISSESESDDTEPSESEPGESDPSESEPGESEPDDSEPGDSDSENDEEENEEIPSGYGLENDPIHTEEDVKEYYSSISKTSKGTQLINELYSLINPKQCSTGYGSVWNYLEYSDADPDNPNSGNIIAYYRGTTTTRSSCNREHVWPDSRGGGVIDGDPHMTRPTLNSDNSGRGNSFYVEGKKSSTSGWDPKTAGLNEIYRGDVARIVMYCAVQEKNNFKLVDSDNDDKNNKSMGKLSDLIKWNYEYPVNKYEKFRNDVLSGFETSKSGKSFDFNRNPFIDDRNLACRIWGDTNDETRSLCAMYTKVNKPTSITLSNDEITLAAGQQIQISVKSVTPADANKNVTWSTSNNQIATVDNTGKIFAVSDGEVTITATSTVDTNVKATCKVIVKTEPVDMTSVSANVANVEIVEGKTHSLNVTVLPSNAYPTPTISYSSKDSSIASVNQNGTITGVKVGQTTIVVSASQNGKTLTDEVNVIVNEKPINSGYNLVTSQSQLQDGAKVVITSRTKSIVAGQLTKTYLNAVEKSDLNSSTTTFEEIPDGAIEFTLEKSGDDWKFKYDGSYLGTGSVKNLTFSGETITWTIDISNGCATIYSTTSSHGRILYNSGAPRFTTYTSAVSSSMLLPELFIAS